MRRRLKTSWDVWIRWQTTDRRAVCNPLAFLVTATTRLAITVLQSLARKRCRPVAAGAGRQQPRSRLGADAAGVEPCSAALLERLPATERAAYVLRQAFDYPYRRIADILRVEEANARQLVTRAREHVTGGRRAPVSPAEQRCLLNAFLASVRTGDLARLERLFASDVVTRHTGGRAPVTRRDRGSRTTSTRHAAAA